MGEKLIYRNGKYRCNFCGSTNILQISVETVYSYPNSLESYIKWDSDYQLYKCDDCGAELEMSN